MIELDIARHSRLIDPQLHVWGWEIPVYLFLGGMAAGLMIVTSLLALRREERSGAARWLAFASPGLVSVGMGALFLDLAHKAHVWRFYLAFRWSSPMSWGAWILLIVYPVSLLVALAGLDEARAERVASAAGRLGLGGVVRAARALGLRRAPALVRANLWLGVALGVYTGILLSTLGARALWSSSLLGPLFLVSGLSTGAAFLLLFGLDAEERRLVTRWDRAAIAVEGAVISSSSSACHERRGGHAAAGLLLGGAFTAKFWSLVVIAGLAVPLLLERSSAPASGATPRSRRRSCSRAGSRCAGSWWLRARRDQLRESLTVTGRRRSPLPAAGPRLRCEPHERGGSAGGGAARGPASGRTAVAGATAPPERAVQQVRRAREYHRGDDGVGEPHRHAPSPSSRPPW